LRRNLFVTGGLWVAEGGYAQVSKSTMRADSWTGSAHSRGMTASCRNQGRTVTLKIDSSAKLEIDKLSAIASDKLAKGCGGGEGANADVDISEVSCEGRRVDSRSGHPCGLGVLGNLGIFEMKVGAVYGIPHHPSLRHIRSTHCYRTSAAS
jgi:hypothetical protein